MNNSIVTEKDGQIGLIRINRPETLNTLDQRTTASLCAALETFGADQDVRCLLVTGHERAFAGDADVPELVRTATVEPASAGQTGTWEMLRGVHKPVLAAVNGYALGLGWELVLACDIVIASESARFGLPQVGLGIMPGHGATQRLARTIGRARTLDLVLTGRMISAREALDLGLVSRVVPAENCLAETRNIGRELCRRSPLALRMAKQSVVAAQETALPSGLALEHSLYRLLFSTDDQKEGMRAFIEKRPPVFMGR